MAVRTKVLMQHRIEDWGAGLVLGHFRNMPIDKASAAGGNWLSRIGPLTTAHTTALRNLRLAFPNETESWRADVARAMWDGIGRTFAEFPHLPELNPGDARCEMRNRERLQAIKESGKGVVFVSGHFSNWELMPMSIAKSGVPCQMTYRPANNPLIDARILEVRESYGAKLQAAKGVEGGVGLMRSLARGVSIALMNDQKYNEGAVAPLFGHDCMTADGPTRLARRFKTALQPMSVRRNGAKFVIETFDPLPVSADAPEDEEIPASIRRINAFVEARVREAPEQWFWVHRRWPKEAWEKAGVL